jgi:hypothetical protein
MNAARNATTHRSAPGSAVRSHRKHRLSPALSATILLGVSSALGAAPDDAQTWMTHGQPGDRLGFALTNVGDLTGDGLPEYAAGAIANSLGAPNAGAVEILSGADGVSLRTILGPNGHSRFGSALAPLDRNGDGTNELLIGAPGAVSNDGEVLLVNLITGLPLRSHLPLVAARNGQFGHAVANLADLDGDSIDDYAIGEPFTGGGAVHVYSGALGTHLYTSEPAGRIRFGYSISGLGADLDGDSVPDFVVGDPFAGGSNRGVVSLLSGATGASIRNWTGSHSETLGLAVLGVPDVDQDGKADLLAGAPGAAPNGASSGKAVVLSSATGFTLHSFPGQSAGEKLGSSLGFADVNGDGIKDFLVGAPEDTRVTEAGRGSVRIYSGDSGWPLYKHFSHDSSSRFGNALATGADLDGDGFEEILAGDPDDSLDHPTQGSVTAIGGREVYLDIEPRTFVPGSVVDVRVGDGTPGALMMLVLVDASGTPLFHPLLVSRFSLSGGWSARVTTSTSIPTGQSFTLRAGVLLGGKVVWTADERAET